MVRVMIADDNADWITSCSTILTKEKDIALCGIAMDGEEAYNSYLINKPDVLLLDLEMPKMSGADVANNLSALPEENEKRNILIVSGKAQEQIKFRELKKIYNLIPKPVNFDFLIQEIYDVAKFNSKPVLNINDIKMVFSKLHLNHFSKGGLYLLDAITLCYDNENLLDNFKCLCVILSHKYNVSEKNIQWSIESSLKTMSKYVKREHLNTFFPYHDLTNRISPKQFIELMLEYINRNIL